MRHPLKPDKIVGRDYLPTKAAPTLESTTNMQEYYPANLTVDSVYEDTVNRNKLTLLTSKQDKESIRHQETQYLLLREETVLDSIDDYPKGIQVAATDTVQALPVYLHPFVTYTEQALTDAQLLID